MKTQTAVGLVFLLLGLFLISIACGPATLALLEHPPRAVTIPLLPLSIGIVLAVFGALIIPASGADVAATKLTVILGKTNLPFVGKGTSGTTVEVTTEPTAPAEPPPESRG